MRYLKRRILKTLAWVNLISFLFFACLVDSNSWIPFIICYINVMWLMLFGCTNNWFERME